MGGSHVQMMIRRQGGSAASSSPTIISSAATLVYILKTSSELSSENVCQMSRWNLGKSRDWSTLSTGRARPGWPEGRPGPTLLGQVVRARHLGPGPALKGQGPGHLVLAQPWPDPVDPALDDHSHNEGGTKDF